MVEVEGGLVKQLSYNPGKVLHAPLNLDQTHFCLERSEYEEIQDGLQKGLVFRVQKRREEGGVPRNVENVQAFGRKNAQEKEVTSPRLQAAPFWLPHGFPPVTFRAFGKELRQLEPGVLTLVWESGPLLLSINGESLLVESPLEVGLVPGDYLFKVEDPAFQPSTFHLSVFFPDFT